MNHRLNLQTVSPGPREHISARRGEVPLRVVADPACCSRRPELWDLLKQTGLDVTKLAPPPITPTMDPTRNEPARGEGEAESPQLTVHILTVSPGPRTNTSGTRTAATGGSPVTALAEVLRNLPASNEAWWSPHTWEGDRRSGRRWVAACAVALDLDFHDPQGRHAAPPPRARAELRDAFGNATGSLIHDTPRGARIVFVLDRPTSDREAYSRAAAGAEALVTSVLEAQGVGPSEGLGGFAVDPAVKDFARVMYAPRAVVHGHARAAEVLVRREQPYPLAELGALAPPSARHPEPFLVQVGEPAKRFDAAVKRWNEDHAEDWGPPGRGECPACHHHGCFGRLPELPEKWSCFSSGPDGHNARTAGVCGREGGSGHWFGDALDLEAFRRGETRLSVLRKDGYLAAMSHEDLKAP